MPKLDLMREMKQLYSPPRDRFVVVDVPPLNYLMIDGHGDPNTAREYAEALEALYSLAYTLKFQIKRESGGEVDFGVMPLEGLWWTEDMAAFTAERKDEWSWTAMILQPDVVMPEAVERARAEAARKKALPALGKARLELYHEGLSAQITHIGPYSAEGPTIQRLHAEFLPANGYAPAGKHHEIYLSDPRRTAPEKLKTVIRQPIAQLGATESGNL
jgi:hypothetical protein